MDEQAFRHTVWARLERCLAGTEAIDAYFQAVVDEIGPLIEVEGSYSISIVLYGHLFSVATSDRKAWDADQVEFDTEEGPCVEALRHGTETASIDLAVDRRWPAWSAVSTLLGFRSAAGVPAVIEGDQRLALNLYAVDAAAFDDDAMLRSRLVAEELARTIPTALRIFEQARLAVDLQEAMASRSTIDQALGVLMAQNRCSRDAAFGILRRASQNRNRKLRDVAAAVIERFTGHPVAEPPPFTPSAVPAARPPRGLESAPDRF